MTESSLKAGLKTLLAGISATALFAATGFIAAFAREQFLGISLRDWSIQSLTILAGKFAADTFFLVLNLAALHWYVLAIALVLACAAVFILRHRKTPAFFIPAAECLLAAPILVWLLISIMNFEAPIIPLHGWVLAPNGESPLSTAIRQLHPKASFAPTSSRRYVQRAISNAAPAPGATSTDTYYFNQSAGPGALLLESSSDDLGTQLNAIGFTLYKPYAALNRLHGAYASAASACVLAFIYLLLPQQGGTRMRGKDTAESPASQPPHEGTRQGAHQDVHQGLKLMYLSDLQFVLRSLVIAGLVIAALLLPYAYGKVIDSTLFPDSYVTYVQPSTDSVDGKATLKNGEYPVIGQTDASIFLLWIQGGGGHTQIVEVPRDKIVELDLQATVDVLGKISDCITQKQGVECQ